MMHFIFQDSQKVQKNSIYLKYKSFVTLYMSTLTFDQLNVSLMNTIINNVLIK